jgi:hypothetical protein
MVRDHSRHDGGAPIALGALTGGAWVGREPALQLQSTPRGPGHPTDYLARVPIPATRPFEDRPTAR